MTISKAIGFSILVLLLAFSAIGCATPKPVMVFQTRSSGEYIRKVAILPFENVSEALDADRKVTSIFLSALYNSANVQIIEQGDVEHFLRANRIRRTGEIDSDTALKLCRTLKSQAIILGTVAEYSYVKGPNGTVPVVSLSIRVIDKSGEIIAAVNHVREGDDSETIFGLGRVTSIIRLSKIVVGDIVKQIVRFIELYNSTVPPEKQQTGITVIDDEGTSQKHPKEHAEKPTKKLPEEARNVPPKKEPVDKSVSDKLTEEDVEKMKEQAKNNALKTWEEIKKRYKAEGDE